ncbi:unnamed protein product [Albugo candida]|uniref:Uncharacterized protein n=1 Tax=Albugo candida TaxID=65357 RepID=A0A024GNX3_9STRA|nr:unnamed protein product [Albugo candida]|eukprot:CCI48476.1 unnamed protein product [Albugo candida]
MTAEFRFHPLWTGAFVLFQYHFLKRVSILELLIAPVCFDRSKKSFFSLLFGIRCDRTEHVLYRFLFQQKSYRLRVTLPISHNAHDPTYDVEHSTLLLEDSTYKSEYLRSDMKIHQSAKVWHHFISKLRDIFQSEDVNRHNETY